ncbi:MAG: c-type cytochrome [Pedosphaera sp.]|nr:c-type cytochrome [Pedosphaera sp.]
MRGERAADEQRSEFLASTDNWFRPVQFGNAPDGCLWVLDMYRETIEHPWSLPANLKKHLDLNSGNDRGRLWRLAPDGFRYDRSRIPVPGETSGLVSLLEHPNGWHRETAARRLYERRDPAAVPELRRMLSGSKSVLGRLHALYSLEGLEALAVDDLVLAARDVNPEVRRHAVELCGLRFPAPSELPNAITRLRPDLELDLDPWVRWSLLLHFGSRLSVDFLARIARVSVDADVRLAALAAGSGRTSALWDKLVADEFRFTGGTDLARELARRRSSEDSVAGTQAVLKSASSWSNDVTAAAAMAGVAEACERSGRPLPMLTDASRERALQIAASTGQVGPASDALHFLIAAGDSSGRTLVDGWLSGPDERRRIQALTVLGNARAAGLPDAVFSRWQPWNRESRRSAVEVMMRRPEWTTALLSHLEAVPSDASAIEPAPLNQLRSHPQAVIRERARKLLGEPPVDREAVIRDYLGALRLKGAADRGQVLYRERCATCHRLKGEGQPLGPDLESVASQGREKLLVNLLDPNREVAPNFAAWTAETRGGETVTGLLVRETTTSIALRQAGGQEVVIDRSRLSSFRTDGRSLMPEGLEVGLSPQQVADLLLLLSGEAR